MRAPVVPGMPRLGTDPGPDRLMTAGPDDAPQADHQGGGAARQEHSYSGGLALDGWSVLHAVPVAPPWMRAELVRLRAAFPDFSFGICPGWRGLTFEAWRNPGAGGVCAVVTRDAGELWHELEESRGGVRRVADPSRNEAR
jgi:hypothetical protein